MNISMIQQTLQNKFKFNEPIFTDEILKAFPNKSRPQVFRYIEQAKENDILTQYDTGVYYLPTMGFLGQSVITGDEVAREKYMTDGNDVYGVYSGITLLNLFHVTTQMAMVPTIVTNKETSKKREVTIKNRRFILKKARCKIDKNNYDSYIVLELFNCIDSDERISKYVVKTVVEYIKGGKIGIMDLAKMAKNFPSKAVKNLMRSGVIDELIQE
jgi:hypothetical protein